MHLIPHVDIDELLKELLGQLQDTLQEKLLGVYLYGSLVTGDFDANVSDIDLLAVLSTTLDTQEFNQLQGLHHNFAAKHPAWYDRVEIAYVSTQALTTFRTRVSKIAVISPGEPFNMKEAGKDWLINWWTIRDKSIPLFGPSATTFLEPISKEEFLQAVSKQVEEWQTWIYQMRQRKEQAYAILTMCRALYAYKNGEQVSKKQAALWAQEFFPQWGSLIQQAVQWREDWREEDVDHEATFAETVGFVQFVGERLEAEIG
jgi:predicted nucleotidyltransferase